MPADASAVDSAQVAYEFKLPDLGEGLTEGEIARWLVSEGQEVAEGDPLGEIQSETTTGGVPRATGARNGRPPPPRRGPLPRSRPRSGGHRRGRRRALVRRHAGTDPGTDA